MIPLRILVAEDDAMITIFLSDVLEAMGHVVCATTSTEADTVAAASLHRPDLIIVDEGLDEGSGISALREIAKTMSVPHVFATGDCYRVLKVVPNAIVLQKPFNVHALASAIERALLRLAATG